MRVYPFLLSTSFHPHNIYPFIPACYSESVSWVYDLNKSDSEGWTLWEYRCTVCLNKHIAHSRLCHSCFPYFSPSALSKLKDYPLIQWNKEAKIYFLAIFRSNFHLLVSSSDTLRELPTEVISPRLEYIITEGGERKHRPFYDVLYQSVWVLR